MESAQANCEEIKKEKVKIETTHEELKEESKTKFTELQKEKEKIEITHNETKEEMDKFKKKFTAKIKLHEETIQENEREYLTMQNLIEDVKSESGSG